MWSDTIRFEEGRPFWADQPEVGNFVERDIRRANAAILRGSHSWHCRAPLCRRVGGRCNDVNRFSLERRPLQTAGHYCLRDLHVGFRLSVESGAVVGEPNRSAPTWADRVQGTPLLPDPACSKRRVLGGDAGDSALTSTSKSKWSWSGAATTPSDSEPEGIDGS